MPDDIWTAIRPDGKVMEYLYRQNDERCMATRREQGRESFEGHGSIAKDLTREQVESLFSVCARATEEP
jgi:hypothetical protein